MLKKPNKTGKFFHMQRPGSLLIVVDVRGIHGWNCCDYFDRTGKKANWIGWDMLGGGVQGCGPLFLI